MVSGPAFEPHQLDSDGEVRAVASEYHCILATTEFSGEVSLEGWVGVRAAMRTRL